KRPELLLPVLGVMFAVQSAASLLEAWRAILLERVGKRLVFALQNAVYDKLQRQSLAYHHDHRIGDLLARAMGDVDTLQDVAVQGIDSLVANALGFLYVAGVLIALNPKLGLATLLPIALVFFLTRYFNLKVKALYREGRDRLGEVSARLQENL